jgi:hypothetical protein
MSRSIDARRSSTGFLRALVFSALAIACGAPQLLAQVGKILGRKASDVQVDTGVVTRFTGDSAEYEARHQQRRDAAEARALARGARPLTTPIPASLSDKSSAVDCVREPTPVGSSVRSYSSSSYGGMFGVRILTASSSSGDGYAVFVRGAEGWGKGGGMRGRNSGGPVTQAMDMQIGDVRFASEFHMTSNVLDIHGVRVPLDSGNVVLVDRIDGVGGPPVVRQVGCVSAGGIIPMKWNAILGIPAVFAFVFDLDR